MNQNNNEATNLAKDFPELVRKIIQAFSRTPERDLHVLVRRYGLDGGPRNTLEELGATYGLTRERIRQIQAKAESRVHDFLAEAPQRGEDIAEAYRSAFHDLLEDLAKWASYSRRGFQGVVQSTLRSEVPDEWLELFAKVVGYDLLVPGPGATIPDLEDRWIARGRFSMRSIRSVFKGLDQIHRSPLAVSIHALLENLRRKDRDGIDQALLGACIAACGRLEIAHGEMVRVRTEWLSSIANQAYRILDSSGKLLHRDELILRVNSYRVGKRGVDATSVEALGNQMAADERFACSGKSGLWGLSEWGVVPELTILEAMQKALHSEGVPLNLVELVAATHRFRPDASEKSIRTYASDKKDLFKKTADGRIALRCWKSFPEAAASKTCATCSVADFEANVDAVRNGWGTMPLRQLVDSVRFMTDLSEVAVRQRFRASGCIVLEPISGSRGKLARFVRTLFREGTVEQTTLRERVHLDIRE